MAINPVGGVQVSTGGVEAPSVPYEEGAEESPNPLIDWNSWRPFSKLAKSPEDVLTALYTDFGLASPRGCERGYRMAANQSNNAMAAAAAFSSAPAESTTVQAESKSNAAPNMLPDAASDTGNRLSRHESSSETVHRNARVRLVRLSNAYPHLINARFVGSILLSSIDNALII
jgi:hypothetical protein